MTQSGMFTIDLTDYSIKEALHTRMRDLGGSTPASFTRAFPKPFASVPQVMVGVAGFDSWRDQDLRFSLNS